MQQSTQLTPDRSPEPQQAIGENNHAQADGHTLTLGERGEQIAASFLADKGYRIVARNWRSSRHGEIDIIAWHGDTLVFVEVKTRSGERFGSPFEAITARKVHRLRRLIGLWLASHSISPARVRLDAVGVRVRAGEISIEHREALR
ncbi:YraN family protein [Pseudoclavibacter soli]|uniref:YraN family protein n=1 Tax=Pseudoclavibacter soli TaxID=452623 RepID=UPI000419B7C8|nr:YraN family protein [Pseudoclavibacter soli]